MSVGKLFAACGPLRRFNFRKMWPISEGLAISALTLPRIVPTIANVPALLRHRAFETAQRSAQCSQPAKAITSLAELSQAPERGPSVMWRPEDAAPASRD